MGGRKFDYIYIVQGDYGYSVKGVDTFPDGVLKGQVRKNFLDSFVTLEEAQKAYPNADFSHELLEPQNTFNHLPDY